MNLEKLCLKCGGFMYRYENLHFNRFPLESSALFVEGDTSIIYRQGDILYKVYTKSEPFRRQKLDYLLSVSDQLKFYSAPPLKKLRVDDCFGMKMEYLDGIDFLKYLSSNPNIDDVFRIIVELSNRLKIINGLDIHFSDLHHHNILICHDVPYYIDIDDASIKNFGSCHISYISHSLHELEGKSYEYEDDLIRYGNLDMESLSIFLLDFILHEYMEKKSYDEFQRIVQSMSSYISESLLDVFSRLKNQEKSLVTIYSDYIGDYLDLNNREGIKRFIKEKL